MSQTSQGPTDEEHCEVDSQGLQESAKGKYKRAGADDEGAAVSVGQLAGEEGGKGAGEEDEGDGKATHHG